MSCIFTVIDIVLNFKEISVERFVIFNSKVDISSGLKNLLSLVLLKIRFNRVNKSWKSCFLENSSGISSNIWSCTINILTASFPEIKSLNYQDLCSHIYLDNSSCKCFSLCTIISSTVVSTRCAPSSTSRFRSIDKCFYFFTHTIKFI